MTEPTDDELDAVLCSQWPAFSMQATLVRMWVRAAMRDAIAKWGTPPAGAGEPVAYVEVSQTDSEVSMTWGPEPAGFDLPSGRYVLFTSPQPIQPQAGAVPLTREQVKAICVESGYEKATLQERADFINGIRHAERHHGIKGGQHG